MSVELLNFIHLVARQDAGVGSDPVDEIPGQDAAPVEEDVCAATNFNSRLGLRIGAIFVILVTSLFGTLLPIILRSSRVVPQSAWEFAKFFGSGVIIATAFIHLLAPAWDSLTAACLVQTYPTFGEYPWAAAIALMALYFVFFAETAAYRLGSAKLAKLGLTSAHHGENAHPTHTHSHTTGANAVAGADVDHPTHSHSHSPVSGSGGYPDEKEVAISDNSSAEVDLSESEVAKQLIGVAVLEFGVILHSVIIGLTLAVDEQFVILFVVIIFHQMFEGLGLGSRLAVMRLPKGYNWVRYAGALAYCICTPVGMAAGLGAIQSFNGNAATANLTTGVLDAFSAGILLYTGLVELIAHEILFNTRMMNASAMKLTYVFGCMMLGSGLMALLGKWA